MMEPGSYTFFDFASCGVPSGTVSVVFWAVDYAGNSESPQQYYYEVIDGFPLVPKDNNTNEKEHNTNRIVTSINDNKLSHNRWKI